MALKPLTTGQLNRKITIQRQTTLGQSPTGMPLHTWAAIGIIFGEVKAKLKGGDVLDQPQANTVAPITLYTVRVRWRRDVVPEKTRFVVYDGDFAGKVLEITGVIDPFGQREELLVSATEVLP